MEKEKYIELKEKTNHGSHLLPFAKYRTRIPRNFTSYPMHWHDEMEIIYVKEGSYIVNIDFSQYVVGAESIIILPPGMLHSFKQNDDEEMKSYTILFSMEMLQNMVPDICSMEYIFPFLEGKFEFKKIITHEEEGFEELAKSLNEIFQIYDEKEKYYELMIKAKLFEIYYSMMRHFVEAKDERLITKYDVSDNIKLVIDHIQNNYMRTITISEMAKMLEFSEAHFMRYFKKHVGVTCIEYINDYRISVAAKMLMGSNQTVGEISNNVGVANVSYFNRMFKKSFGVSPIEYRKNTAKQYNV